MPTNACSASWPRRPGWATRSGGQIDPEPVLACPDDGGGLSALAWLGALLGVFLVARMAPSVGWLDGGSLVAASWTMGVAHPPGESGYLPGVRLAQLLPIGDIAFRANLVSVAAHSLCAVPLFLLGWGLAREALLDAPLRSLCGVGAALVALLPLAAQAQGLRAEVYSLTALLLLSALACAVLVSGRRGSAGTGLLLGWAAAVHPLLAVAALPSLVVARLLCGFDGSRARLPAHLGWGFAFGLVGFAHCLWLPLRARAVPAWSWGVPDTPARFADVLLARTFVQNFGPEAGSGGANLQVVVEQWGRSGVLALAVLGAIAVALTFPRSKVALIAVPVAIWPLANLATVLPQNKLYPDNPDVLGYLFVGGCALAPLAVLGAVLLFSSRPGEGAVHSGGPATWRAVAAGMAVGLLSLWLAADGWGAGRTGNHLARRFATDQAAGLPPGSLLMTSGNDTAFLWTYLHGVERRRPDLLLVHRVLLGHRHERVRLEDRLGRAGLPWDVALRDRPLGVVSGSPPGRGFFIELREAEAPYASQLLRHGLVERWVPPGQGLGEGSAEDPWLEARRQAGLAELSGPAVRHDAPARGVRDYYLALHDELEEGEQ